MVSFHMDKLQDFVFLSQSFSLSYQKSIWDLFCSGKLNLCSFLLYSVYSGKFEVKKKKNNPKLAVNIMQEIEKETMQQECFIRTLSSCFDRLANSVIFPAEFASLSLNTREIVLLILEPKKQGKT